MVSLLRKKLLFNGMLHMIRKEIKKTKKLVIILAIISIIVIIIIKFFLLSNIHKNAPEQLVFPVSPQARETAVMQMMGKHFVSRYGLIGDKIEKNEPPDYALLETMGQIMEYAVLTKENDLFMSAWAATKKYMRSPQGYFYWRVNIKDLQPDDATALIDELRLAKSLVYAAGEFGKPEYIQEAERLTASIFNFSVEDNLLCDGFDGKSNDRERKISLFFIDTEALQILAGLSGKFDVPTKNAIKLLIDAPEDVHGFFPTWYDYNTGEYHYSSKVNMVENLYSAHMAWKAGRDISKFRIFMANELSKTGHLYNSYYRDGRAAGDAESTAVYALACRLFINHKEWESAFKCYQRMVGFQIVDEGHPLQGGFGDGETSSAYAFDQMEALITLHAGRDLPVERN